MAESNEELLREGECVYLNCIKDAGHEGPHSAQEPTITLSRKLVAQVVEALESFMRTCSRCHGFPEIPELPCVQCKDARAVLAALQAEMEGK